MPPHCRFAYVADMQPGSPKSYRFQPAWLENWLQARKQLIELKPDFMLVGGDITRDGAIHRWELEEMKHSLDAMGVPYHAIPGNMDVGNKHTDIEGPNPNRRDTELGITSEALAQFESVFGPSKWSVVHGDVRISGFCDILLGSGLPEEEQLWAWLEARKTAPRARHHVWIMHYALFIERPDEGNWDVTDRRQYRRWYFSIDEPYRSRLMDIFRATGATRVITGHVHCRKEHFVNGIHFDLAPSAAFGQAPPTDRWQDADTTPGFLLFESGDEGLRKRFVPLERVSTRNDGYGPGGHPPPEMRDYSPAWER